MSFFDQAYDEMSWQEICYRLPSGLAVNALKRRINNLETVRMFFDNAGSQPANIKALKDHVNDIIAGENVDDILTTFDEKYHPVLFNWLTAGNMDRIKNHDPSKLGTKFLFNLTNPNDAQGLQEIFSRILAEQTPTQSQIRSVLRKADDVCLPPLLNMILKDSRPEIRACILCVPGLTNKELVSDHQKAIGLKALAQCKARRPLNTINVMSINVFSALKPLERLDALESYLGYFPKYRRVNAFDPMPTDEEFQMILFAGCIEYNDRVSKLNDLYKEITQMDPPHGEDEEEDI